mmetsp:Transcript_951/g.1774  ORF Transcript_951/g.1774 Transcript_951/m.1774 type:complete len:382 (-) Transcript_951:972-2117(-)
MEALFITGGLLSNRFKLNTSVEFKPQTQSAQFTMLNSTHYKTIPVDILSVFNTSSSIRIDKFLSTLNLIPSRNSSHSIKFLKSNSLTFHPHPLLCTNQPMHQEFHRIEFKKPTDKIPLNHLFLYETQNSQHHEFLSSFETFSSYEHFVNECIQLNGVSIGALARPLHYAIYKEVGLTCAKRDPNVDQFQDLIYSGIPARDCYESHAVGGIEWKRSTEGVNTIGRLDKMARGLILATESGDLINMVNRSGMWKCYEVGVEEGAQMRSERVCERMESGEILLRDRESGEVSEQVKAARCEYDEKKKVYRVQIQEGKYHQLRRMFGALGMKVVSINRIWIGHHRFNQEFFGINQHDRTINQIPLETLVHFVRQLQQSAASTTRI